MNVRCSEQNLQPKTLLRESRMFLNLSEYAEVKFGSPRSDRKASPRGKGARASEHNQIGSARCSQHWWISPFPARGGFSNLSWTARCPTFFQNLSYFWRACQRFTEAPPLSALFLVV